MSSVPNLCSALNTVGSYRTAGTQALSSGSNTFEEPDSQHFRTETPVHIHKIAQFLKDGMTLAKHMAWQENKLICEPRAQCIVLTMMILTNCFCLLFRTCFQISRYLGGQSVIRRVFSDYGLKANDGIGEESSLCEPPVPGSLPLLYNQSHRTKSIHFPTCLLMNFLCTLKEQKPCLSCTIIIF